MPDVDGQITDAIRTLASLKNEANELRAELVNLHEDKLDLERELTNLDAKLVVACQILQKSMQLETSVQQEHQLDTHKILTLGTQLKAANEQLVIAALNAETIAETAMSDLTAVTRTSQRDALTDTPNRTLMFDRLENAITIARRRGTRFAVLFVDVDHFKKINDTLGHAIGDEVLKFIARQLEAVVRESDTVSRHGGDEFLVLLSNVVHPADAGVIAQKMLDAIATSVCICGHDLMLSVSLGIALYPDHARNATVLIDLADAAMYTVKRKQRGGFAFHH